MFFKKAASVFFTQVLGFFLALAASIMIARSLGPVAKGQLALATTFIGVIGLVSNPALGAASVYWLNRKSEARTEIASSAVWLQMVLAIVAVIVTLLVLPWLAEYAFRGEVPTSLLLLMLLQLPISAFLAALSSLLLGMQQIWKMNYLRIISGVIQVILLAVLVALGHLTLPSAIIIAIISTIAAAAPALYWLHRIDLSLRFRISLPWSRTLMSYGLKGWIGNLLQFFNYRFDVFVVNLLLGAGPLGIYSVAVTLAESLWYIPNAVATVLFPRTAANWDEARRFTPLVSRQTAFVTALGAVGMAIVGFPLILLYGKRFIPAIGPLLALLPGIVILSVGKVLASDLSGRGKPQYGAVGAVASLVVTVILDFLLIPRMGITGAGVASSLSYAVNTLVLLFYYVRLSGNSASSVLLIRQQDLIVYRDLWERSFTTLKSRMLGPEKP